MKLLKHNIVPLLALIAAIALEIYDKDGFGWCIFLALLTYSSNTEPEVICVSHEWVEFEQNVTYPRKYGKYFVRRKDGKIHWETWNGVYWAYNGNVITHFMEVFPPKCVNTINKNNLN